MEQVKGKRVLDIGCSQGITSILLGREGKNVIGVDSLKHSIDIANKALSLEEDSVKERVKFFNDNILSMRNKLGTFNTVILGEVLEHFADWEALLEKALEFGRENCRFIITVPFGINDYFDHKRTYYYSDLYFQLSKYFEIEKTFFMGKWLGVTCIKRENENNIQSISIDIVRDMEREFYNIERNLIDSNKRLIKINNDNDIYIKKLENEIRENDTFQDINSFCEKLVNDLIKKNDS